MATTSATEMGCNLGRRVGLAGFVHTVWLFGLWVKHPGWRRNHLILKSFD